MTISSEQLKLICKEILHTLRAWRKSKSVEPVILSQLLLFQNHQVNLEGTSPHTNAKALVESALVELEKLNPEYAALLNHRFVNRNTILETALEFSSSEDKIKKAQRLAINSLGQIVADKENKLRKALLNKLEKEIDAQSFTELFGIQDQIERVAEALEKQENPWIIGLTGIGGVGKTSLAIAAVRKVVAQFKYDHVGWVKLSQTVIEAENFTAMVIQTLFERFFPAYISEQLEVDGMKTKLDRFFKENVALVVIDNLELPLEVTYLLPLLNGWSQPSKFLLTARSWSSEISQAQQIRLADLSEDDAFALFSEQTKVRGYLDILNYPEEKFKQLYRLIGGNPLMVKLAVSLVAIYPFGEVLDDLQNGHTDKTGWTYRYIYMKLWASLSQEAKQLLEAMPMTGRNGAGINQIIKMSRLDRGQTLNAIDALINRSLLELRGPAEERRYSIHPLTSTFISTEIIALPDAYVLDRGRYLD